MEIDENDTVCAKKFNIKKIVFFLRRKTSKRGITYDTKLKGDSYKG